jgi:GNAT superfamily N-acetyltransferase
MTTIALRPETEADEDFLRRLYASARAGEMALVPWPDEQKAAFLNQQFDLQRHHYRTYYPDAERLVVSIDGRPAGRRYLHRGEEFFLLMDICLLPEYRGRGLGRRLLEALLAEAGAAGKPVRLHVERFNPARNLYARLGFTLIEERSIHRLMEWRPA